MSTDSSTIAVKCFFVLVNSRMLVFLVMEIISFKHICRAICCPVTTYFALGPCLLFGRTLAIVWHLQVIQNKLANLYKFLYNILVTAAKNPGSIYWSFNMLQPVHLHLEANDFCQSTDWEKRKRDSHPEECSKHELFGALENGLSFKHNLPQNLLTVCKRCQSYWNLAKAFSSDDWVEQWALNSWFLYALGNI